MLKHYAIFYEKCDLAHHGVKGQKWGIRRYQNKDGSLTAEGRSRYNQESQKLRKEDQPYQESNRIEKYYGIKHIYGGDQK